MAASSSTDELPADADSAPPRPISIPSTPALESMMAAMMGRLDMMSEEMAAIRLTQVAQDQSSGQSSKRSLAKVRHAASSVSALRATDESVIHAMQLGDGDQHFDQFLHDGNGDVEHTMEVSAALEQPEDSRVTRLSISDPGIEHVTDAEGVALAAAGKQARQTVASRDGWAGGGGERRRCSLFKSKSPPAAQEASSSPAAQAEGPAHGRPGRRHSTEPVSYTHLTLPTILLV